MFSRRCFQILYLLVGASFSFADFFDFFYFLPQRPSTRAATTPTACLYLAVFFFFFLFRFACVSTEGWFCLAFFFSCFFFSFFCCFFLCLSLNFQFFLKCVSSRSSVLDFRPPFLVSHHYFLESRFICFFLNLYPPRHLILILCLRIAVILIFDFPPTPSLLVTCSLLSQYLGPFLVSQCSFSKIRHPLAFSVHFLPFAVRRCFFFPFLSLLRLFLPHSCLPSFPVPSFLFSLFSPRFSRLMCHPFRV